MLASSSETSMLKIKDSWYRVEKESPTNPNGDDISILPHHLYNIRLANIPPVIAAVNASDQSIPKLLLPSQMAVMSLLCNISLDEYSGRSRVLKLHDEGSTTYERRGGSWCHIPSRLWCWNCYWRQLFLAIQSRIGWRCSSDPERNPRRSPRTTLLSAIPHCSPRNAPCLPTFWLNKSKSTIYYLLAPDLPQHLLRDEDTRVISIHNRVKASLNFLQFLLSSQAEIFLAVCTQIFLFISISKLNFCSTLYQLELP